MSNKTTDTKRRVQAAKKVGISAGKSKKDIGLKEQYSIIRQDLVKLRADLAKGYDMTKDWIDKNSTVRGLLPRTK